MEHSVLWRTFVTGDAANRLRAQRKELRDD